MFVNQRQMVSTPEKRRHFQHNISGGLSQGQHSVSGSFLPDESSILSVGGGPGQRSSSRERGVARGSSRGGSATGSPRVVGSSILECYWETQVIHTNY
jgi:hypothetical protein